MGKRTRIVLYALSLVTMLAMVTLIIFSHGRQSGEPAKDALSETDISSTEEPVQIPEAEESEETEAADGQNRIQNDTEQEEADIAGGETDKQAEAGNTEGDGSTTLIFAGDVLFANAFSSSSPCSSFFFCCRASSSAKAASYFFLIASTTAFCRSIFSSMEMLLRAIPDTSRPLGLTHRFVEFLYLLFHIYGSQVKRLQDFLLRGSYRMIQTVNTV